MSAGESVGAPSLMVIRRRHTARNITAATPINKSGDSVDSRSASQISLANSGHIPSSIGMNQTSIAHFTPLPLAMEVASSKLIPAAVSNPGQPTAWATAAGSRTRNRP